ncbi:MAG TPA: tRNA preQ1(34) S-adenosylmethionine ribosyltransferase-isomerase QueA [Candidatus Woesebacteria bacterium]|nr:tRNA preQ1(34) S-adenosylmethionine ribosyltransferase-isomerase QueA [Candidatus Woesebacteria bacterium]
MDLSDFQYDLPQEFIGQKAIEPRDSCRLLVVNRKTKQISSHIFRDLVKILDKNIVLVINDTKVFPARLYGRKETGGKLEILLLSQTGVDSYRAIAKGKLHPNIKIIFSEDFFAIIEQIYEDGEIELKFNLSGSDLFDQIDKIGHTPLPPYIHSNAKEEILREQYQTVYAREKGSAAAPTAGLHFTEKLLSDLKEKGIEVEKVTLHVGLGTFKPVTPEQITSKTLHTERYFLTEESAMRLNMAKKEGKKIIAVGTTSCRLLETLSDKAGEIHSGQGETNIFIQPGYRYKFVDGLITNFHLPSTSLLMLVSALTLKPNTFENLVHFQDSLIGRAYQEAIKQKYKFFSFGDAMLIL